MVAVVVVVLVVFLMVVVGFDFLACWAILSGLRRKLISFASPVFFTHYNFCCCIIWLCIMVVVVLVVMFDGCCPL